MKLKLETKAKKIRAKLPSQGSKTFRILEALHSGMKVSMLDCHKFKCTSITQRIGDLRYKFGWPIQDKIVRQADGYHKVYWL